MLGPVLFAIAAAGATLFALGVFVARRSARRDREAQAEARYREAVSVMREGNATHALALAAESVANEPSSAGYSLHGHAWGLLGEFGKAASSYYEARRYAGSGVNTPPVWHAEAIAENYQAEAEAHGRAGAWDFAHKRAGEALWLMERNRIPRYVEHGDCESWTRFTRMVAASQLGWDGAREDAEWLLSNSRVLGYGPVAQAVLDGDPAIVLERWLNYDMPRRGRFFVDGEEPHGVVSKSMILEAMNDGPVKLGVASGLCALHDRE